MNGPLGIIRFAELISELRKISLGELTLMSGGDNQYIITKPDTMLMVEVRLDDTVCELQYPCDGKRWKCHVYDAHVAAKNVYAFLTGELDHISQTHYLVKGENNAW